MAVQGLSPAAGGEASNLSPAAEAPRKEASKITTVVTQALAQSSSTSSILSAKGKGEEDSFFSACSGSSETYESTHHAARCGDTGYVAAQLRDGGFDPNALLDERLPLIHAAIEGNHEDVLSIILSHNPDTKATFLVRDDLPPLDPCAYAVFSGAIDSFDLLLEQAGDTPPTYKIERIGNWLHLAIRFMQYEIVIHLRRTHPKLFTEMMKSKDSQKQTPQQLAIKLEDRDALTALLGEKKSKETPLSQEAPTPFNPSIVEFNGGVGAGAMAFVGAMQVLEEQNAIGSIEAFLGYSAGVIVAALAALGCSSQEMQYWINQFPLNQILDERADKEATFKPVDFRPEYAKKQPTALIKELNERPYLCKGSVLKYFLQFMVEQITLQKDFTLQDLRNQVNKRGNKHHLIVPIRKEDGQVEIIRSDHEKYGGVRLIPLLEAAVATPGLYPRVNILAIENGKEKVFLPNCSDPSLARCKSTNFTCYDETDLPYLRRGVLRFSLSSSAPPIEYPSLENDSIQQRALYLIRLHHAIRRLHPALPRDQRSDQVSIDIQGHGISSDPILFLNAGRAPTQKYFRSRSRALPPLAFTPYDRPKLTKEIEERVLFTERESFKETRRLTILQSSSGMGKSTLVHMVISKLREHFSDLLIIDYDTPSTTYITLRIIAESLDLYVEPYEDNSAIEQKIKELLEEYTPNKPWLLICENCHQLPSQIFPQSGGSIICCITRKPNEPHIDNAFIIPPLELSQALELLIKETQAIRQMGDLTKLAKRLDNNAQALMLAARYIKEHAISIAEYLALLGPQSEGIDPSSETIGVALKYLYDNMPLFARCIAVFAHLAPDAIPEEWVDRWLPPDSADAYRPTVYETLTHLERCGLITYHSDRHQFSIHRKMRLAIQEHTIEEQANIEELMLLMVSLKEGFKRDNPSTWPFGRTWAIHAHFLMEATKQMQIDPHHKGMIYQTLGEIHLCTGEAQRAIEVFQTANEVFKQVENSEKTRAHVLLGLGLAALERLDLTLAKESFEDGLKLTHAGDSLEPYCSLQCGLGDTHSAQRSYVEAKAAYSVVEEKNQSRLHQHLSKAYPMAKLGWAETCLAEGSEDGVTLANEILKGADNLFRHLYRTDLHPDVARRYLLLARVYCNQGKIKPAEKNARKALAIYKTLYPRKTHPQVALAYSQLAQLCLVRGQLKTALKRNHQALSIMNYIFPKAFHPIKVNLLKQHATILEKLRRYQDACDSLIEQLALLKQCAELEIKEAKQVKLKADALYTESSYKKALPFYRAISLFYLSYNTEDPAQTLHLIAQTAFDKKHYEVSIQLRKDALTVDRQEPIQPFTDFTAQLHACIGLAYTHLENYEQAHNHLEEAVKIYSNLYPDVSEIANSPYGLAHQKGVPPLHKAEHLLAAVQLYQNSADIYEKVELTEETVANHAMLVFPVLRSLAERYYSEKKYLISAHHWQSLITFLTSNGGTLKDCAYAYYRCARSQYKGGKRKMAETSAEIAQEKWEKLVGEIPDPTPLNRAEERATLLIYLGKTQYLRWQYYNAATTFQQADYLLEQLITHNKDPDKTEEWQKLRTFLAQKIRANSSSLNYLINYP